MIGNIFAGYGLPTVDVEEQASPELSITVESQPVAVGPVQIEMTFPRKRSGSLSLSLRR